MRGYHAGSKTGGHRQVELHGTFPKALLAAPVAASLCPRPLLPWTVPLSLYSELLCKPLFIYFFKRGPLGEMSCLLFISLSLMNKKRATVDGIQLFVLFCFSFCEWCYRQSWHKLLTAVNPPVLPWKLPIPIKGIFSVPVSAWHILATRGMPSQQLLRASWMGQNEDVVKLKTAAGWKVPNPLTLKPLTSRAPR